MKAANYLFMAWLCALAAIAPARAQDPLDSLFLEDSAATLPGSSVDIAGNLETASTAFGGTLSNHSGYAIRRDYAFGNADLNKNLTFSYMRGDFFLDSRLENGVKGHASLSVIHVSDAGPIPYSGLVAGQTSPAPASQTLVQLNEFFLDISLARLAYVRAGQQSLRWGQGFFWNPVDLANVDRKDFVEVDRARRGVNGLRLTIPYQARFSYQVFLDANKVSLPAQYAVTNRVEALLGPLELAAYLWNQRGRKPIPGFDLSLPIGSWGFYAEGIFLFETPKGHVPADTFRAIGLDPPRERGAKALVGVHKRLLRDKLFFGGEAYYNGLGAPNGALMNERFRDSLALGAIPYQAFDLNRWYAAFYSQYGQLLRRTVSLGINVVANCSDGSFLVYPSLAFSHVDNFLLELKPVFYAGKSSNREMTFRNQFADILLDLSLRF